MFLFLGASKPSLGWSSWVVRGTGHLHLVPRLGMNGTLCHCLLPICFMVCKGDNFTFRNTCCTLDDNEKYIHFKLKTLWGEKTSSSQIVVSQATGRDPNNFTYQPITNFHYFDKFIGNSTFCRCDHLRWPCNNVGVTLMLHKRHRTLTARVANRRIEILPTRQTKLYFFIFLRRSCHRVGKIFLIWGQEQFKILKIL